MGYTLLVDNYDSFTWNIYADIATLGGNPLVRRNDKITIADVQVSPVGSWTLARRQMRLGRAVSIARDSLQHAPSPPISTRRAALIPDHVR